MKVVTSAQMKQIEDNSLLHELTYYRLMENAGSAAAAFIRRTFSVDGLSVILFCGRGNNGGDGLVVARKLAENGARVLVVLVEGMPRGEEANSMYSMVELMELPVSKDFDTAYDQLAALVSKADLVVDALFGTGFHGSLDQRQAKACDLINSAIAAIISLDVPSGVECDTGRAAQGAVKADFTIAFDSYKPLHILPGAAEHLGEVVLTDIGIPPEAKEGIGREYLRPNREQILSLLPPRHENSHKGTFGWLLNIAGCANYRGAAALSTLAALRAGAGRVTLASTELVCQCASSHVLEAIHLPLPATPEGIIDSAAAPLLEEAMNQATAILFGCGLKNTPHCRELLAHVLLKAECPVVIDADGLNALAENIHILDNHRSPVLLTPHPGEMARMLGITIREVEANRYLLAADFAAKHNVILVLKGHETITASPDNTLMLNSTGNAGLAKAGSGDLLAGMIGGLLAQGLAPKDAAVCGVFLHGLAADQTARRLTRRTMLPSDILEDIHLDPAGVQPEPSPEETGEEKPAASPSASSRPGEAPAQPPDPPTEDPPIQFLWSE